MSQILEISQISIALRDCLDSLDALGLAAAAAFVDSALRSISFDEEAGLNRSLPSPRIDLQLNSNVDFSELDRIIEVYFCDMRDVA